MPAAVTDYFKKVGSPGNATSLASPGHTIGGTTFTVDSTSLWPTDTGVTFAVDVVTLVNGEEVRTTGTYTVWDGVVSSATTITGAVLRHGTDQNYSAGTLTRVYILPTSTRENKLVDGILVNHNQTGTHKTLTDDSGNEWIKQTSTASAVNEVTIANAATGNGPTISATGDNTNIDLNFTAKGTGQIKYTGRHDAWNTGVPVPDTVAANGNRSYTLTHNSTDLTDYLSAGMRLRTERTVASPTQCTSLNGTTQYYSKSSPAAMTFTDDFVVSAWVKLSSYAAAGGSVVSRTNGTSGWQLIIQPEGTVRLAGYNAGLGNQKRIDSYQSIPLNKWVHIAAELDMNTATNTSTTNYVMIDGVDVPAVVGQAGTNPTALVQAGDLQIGAYNGATSPFPGKIAQVAIYNAKVTQATIKASISQGLSGSETSLISAYSFNNTITDLSANANNLTANGAAVATNADSPFGTQASGLISATLDYGIIQSVTFSTNTTVTVRVPEGNTIPTSGGVSAVSYSTQASPYGFSDSMANSCRLLAFFPVQAAQTTTSTGAIVQFNPITNYSITIPSDCSTIKFHIFNASVASGAANVVVMKLYNGAVNTTANELVQVNTQTGNGLLSATSIVPVTPGEVINFNVGWLTTGGTATWSASGAARQVQAIWVEVA